MKYFCFLLLLSTTFSTAQSNRKAIYPIILVHGLNSSDATWYPLMQEYKNFGYNVSLNNQRADNGSRIEFNLNADNDVTKAKTDFKYEVGKLNYGDVLDRNTYIDPNNDVFAINFDLGNSSNESAIVKQGFALGIAIQKVLAATKAEKVILVGHSMGGLAIREYLQSSRFLFLGNNLLHNVYRVVTIGTPYGGCDNGTNGFNLAKYFAGFNERSEAVRDLRTTHVASGQRGVYLFGGNESNATYANVGQTYFNTDIDCNGQSNYVEGLNTQKEKILPRDIYYECIIGKLTTTTSNDGVVTVESQNLNNYIKKVVDGITFDIAVTTTIPNVIHATIAGVGVAELSKARDIIKSAMLTINVPIKISSYYVFLTGNYINGKTLAYASFFIEIPEKGRLDATFLAPVGVKSSIVIRKNNAIGEVIAIGTQAANYLSVEKGRYFIELYGEIAADFPFPANLYFSFKPDITIATNPNTVSDEDYVLYPNPTNGVVQIKSKNKPQNIACFDEIGRPIEYITFQNGAIGIMGSGLVIVRIDNTARKVWVNN